MHWLSISVWQSVLWMGLTFFSTTPNEQEHIVTNVSGYDDVTGQANQQIELDNIDVELLNTTLFNTLNKKRTKGKRTALKFSPTLTQACKYVVENRSVTGLQRLRNKKNQANRIGEKCVKEHDFYGAYTNIVTDAIPLLKIKDKQKYTYNDELDDGVLFYFDYGKKAKTDQSIPIHTYQSLVDQFITRSGKMNGMSEIKNKTYSEFGCYISIEQKTPEKIPYAKMTWMVGGYRLGLVKD